MVKLDRCVRIRISKILHDAQFAQFISFELNLDFDRYVGQTFFDSLWYMKLENIAIWFLPSTLNRYFKVTGNAQHTIDSNFLLQFKNTSYFKNSSNVVRVCNIIIPCEF